MRLPIQGELQMRPQPAESTTAVAESRPVRLTCIDAFRGLVMLMMMAEILEFCDVAAALPNNTTWQTLCFHQSHVAWRGWSLHDLIQPGFSFLVGAALPFSLAARRRKGHSFPRMFLHAVWRAGLLIVLGIWLRSLSKSQTNFTFDDTLTQIGLGYSILFLVGWCKPVWQWSIFGLIVVGYGVAFAAYPLPGPDFDWSAVGVPDTWQHPAGLAAHWDKNSNLAWAVDRWWLNLFPRQQPFEFHPGGYATLSFIPTLATMILGLIAGGVLKNDRSGGVKILILLALGAACAGIGRLLGIFDICPIVKRIWTPSWILYSGGLVIWILALFYATTDLIRVRFWVFPLVVLGANSIVAYCSDWLIVEFLRDNFAIHLGPDYFERFGVYEPVVSGGAVLGVIWLILFWMYRKKIFVRI
jgi:heparan-alpha-glucosaminide N-acetyltransferase